MLRHILFCADFCWLKIICAFKILFGKTLEKKETEKKEKKGKKLLGSKPQPAAGQGPKSAGAPPLLFSSAADTPGPPVSALFFFSTVTEPETERTGNPGFLGIPSQSAGHAPIKPSNQPRSSPFASKSPKPSPSYRVCAGWISPRSETTAARREPRSLPFGPNRAPP